MTYGAWLPLLLLSTTAVAQNASSLNRDHWLRLALRTQNYLTRSNSIATNLYCGTYQSANSLHYSSLRTEATFGGSSDSTQKQSRHFCPEESEPGKCFTATGTFRLFDQMYSIEEQLDFGVRRFLFPLVRVGILTPELRVCKPVPDVCRNLKRELSGLGLYDYAWNVDICYEILGMRDYDEFTGCTEDSLTWSAMLRKFRDFLKRNGNSREIIIIEVDTSIMQQRYGCSAQSIIENPIRDILGDLIYTPADLTSFTRSTEQSDFFDPFNTPVEWPTPTQIFSRGKQIILMAPCQYSGRWFHQSTDFRKFQEISSAKEFVPFRCGTRKDSGGFISALNKQFTGIYEDRTNFEMEIQADDGFTQGYVYLADGIETSGTMDERAAERIINCGFSPMFSRMQENRIFECAWFWGEGESSLCEKGLCTAFQLIRDPESIRKYKFVNVDCERKLPVACRDEQITTSWGFGRDIVFPNETGPELENRIALYCPDFHVYDIPKSPDDAATLQSAMSQNNFDLVWVRYTAPITCHRDSSLNPPANLYDVSGQSLLALSAYGFLLSLAISIF